LDVLLKLSRAIDWVNYRLGRLCALLILVTVLISAGNAISRRVFALSSNAWLEMQWYLFSAIFLLCASWTLIVNEHIRIDIVSNFFSKRVRDWIDLIGHAFFLLPFTIVMIVTSWPFFLASYRVNEQSSNAGGLLQWPVKFLIPLGFTLLFFQGISELIKRAAVMQGRIPDPYGHVHHPAEVEVAEVIATIEKR
jgi:TRAP-type mannitol/chloroaromatic compound transport system permease small subunit